VDAGEWNNLAGEPEREEIKKKLTKMIPINQLAGFKVQDWFGEFQK